MKVLRCLLGKSRRVAEAERMMAAHRVVAAREIKVAKQTADAASELMRRLQKDVTQSWPR